MAEQKVNIKVSTTGAKKSKDELSGLTGSINKMGKAVGVASAAYFGAKGLINAFSSVVGSAARQEQAEKALEVALGRTSKSLLDQASALQKVTTAGDEAIIEQQAFLASLKFTEDQIKTILPVALDLSAATGISLESAVRNTSKTFSGLAGELGELVPQLRDLTKEEMEAGKAVEVLGNLFEGQASKQAQTMSGAIEQMSNAVGDAGEAIGIILSPVVIAVAESIKTLAERATTAIASFKNFGDTIVTIGERFGIFKEKAEEVPPVIEKTVESVNKLNEKTAETDIGKPFREFLENQAPALEAGYDQFINTLVDADMSGKERRELAFEATKNAFIRTAGEMIKEKIKTGALEASLDKISIARASASNAIKSAIQSSGAVAGYIRSLFQTMPWFLAGPLALGGGAYILSIIKSQQSQIAAGASSPIGFADGGIVQGDPSTGDSVPAILTPGEIILNASQQQGLLNNMGGVTVNIQGNMIGNEEFVRDTLIPEIDKTVNRGLA